MRAVISKVYRTLLFYKQYFSFKSLAKNQKRFAFRWKDRWPCLYDSSGTTGYDRHYIYHPAWAARILARQNPKEHIDISSTLHFCTLVSAFIPVKFYDYRPANLFLSGLVSEKADLIKLPFKNDSIASLSCMHVIEHVGLGRYGDPLDYDGDLKSMRELARVLALGGDLLFVVPVGAVARIQYNAHRVYTHTQVIEIFLALGLSLQEFALIPELEKDGGLVVSPSEDIVSRQKYGCGCFWFKKIVEGPHV